MSDLEDKIIAFKVNEEEYTMLQGLAQMLYDNKKLPKPTVNAMAKSLLLSLSLTNLFRSRTRQVPKMAKKTPQTWSKMVHFYKELANNP